MPRKQEISERSENGEVIWCFTGVSLAGGFAAERKRHCRAWWGWYEAPGRGCLYIYIHVVYI